MSTLLERGVILSLHKKADPKGPIYIARVRFNYDHGGHTEVSGFSFGDITRAIGKAVHKAASIMQLPGLNLLIPPPFNTAIALADHLGKLAAQGKLTELVRDPISGLMVPFFSQIKNPTIRKLAEHMAKVPGAAAKFNIMGEGNAINLSKCVEDMSGRGRGGWRPRYRGGAWGPYAYPYADVFEPLPGFEMPVLPVETLPASYHRIYGPQPGRFAFHRWPLHDGRRRPL
jgi:hypothetical protein